MQHLFYMPINANGGHFWIDPHLNYLMNHDAKFNPNHPDLTEFDIQLMIRLNFPEEEIAQELDVDVSIVRHVLQKLIDRLGVSNKDEVISSALNLGFHLLEPCRFDTSTGKVLEDRIAETYCSSKWW